MRSWMANGSEDFGRVRLVRESRPPAATGLADSNHRHAASIHRWCDVLTEACLYLLIALGPWAFGTTQSWSINLASGIGYVLGCLWVTKLGLRRWGGYRPGRWDQPQTEFRNPSTDAVSQESNPAPTARAANLDLLGPWMTRLAAFLTIYGLVFTLVSALNPRAVYDPQTHVLLNRSCIQWLPHSYDSPSTWLVFWQYVSLAAVFWAMRDWLLVQTHREQLLGLAERIRDEGGYASAGRLSDSTLESLRNEAIPGLRIPARLRRLLWVICLNGALLAVESIVQRLDGTDKLLWLIKPRINQQAEMQFGPYAYRSNGAQYLNLVWPVCLGFWFLLRQNERASLVRDRRIGSGAHVVLLPGVVVMSAAAVLSFSRGGAAVAITSWLAALALLFFASRRTSPWMRTGLVALFLISIILGAAVGGTDLRERLKNLSIDKLSERVPIYHNAMQMAEDHPWFGTGPGTFCTLYQYYMGQASERWVVQAHNDWLETRITFGQAGMLPLILLLAVVLVRGFFGKGICVPWFLAAMIWLSLAGCLFHAWFDFPLQILSILELFIMLCAIAFVIRPTRV
jgi:hypothetical protein